ncbi:hypothetical protein PMIN01_02669 [Paraphaeosphaeria minitans]|uniref:Uncharacterized protein n=1 Tax=Paraphaeosphaeria minitans TaxID=565426 RepID=A0A9P6KVM8_9PLEO|nr:hypothetical protein PMIN01_02669 [Paraphaeosphaeria minitans]
MIGMPRSTTQERIFWMRRNRLNWRFCGSVEEYFIAVPEHFPLNPEGRVRGEAVRGLVHLPVIPRALFFYLPSVYTTTPTWRRLPRPPSSFYSIRLVAMRILPGSTAA